MGQSNPQGLQAWLGQIVWDPSPNLSTSHPHTWLIARLAKPTSGPERSIKLRLAAAWEAGVGTG